MKDLRREHEDNRRRHAEAMAAWELLDERSRQTREKIAGLRPDTVSR
jgi:hypothetical protein